MLKKVKRTGDTAQGMSFRQIRLPAYSELTHYFTDSIGRGDNPAGGVGITATLIPVGPHERSGHHHFADRL